MIPLMIVRRGEGEGERERERKREKEWNGGIGVTQPKKEIMIFNE